MTPERAAEQLASPVTVALLVATAESAPRLAWQVARAAAAGGRQVALVDLVAGDDGLAAEADDRGDEGIVDVFEFGASWNHVARPQEPATLHFVPHGTPPADPHALWGHARWEKLRRGFRQADALLLLFVPPRALADLAPRADTLVTLGDGPAVANARSLAAGRDLPLVALASPAVVLDDPPDAPTEPGAPTDTPTPRRWLPWLAGLAAAAAVFAAAFTVLRDREQTPPPAPQATAPVSTLPPAVAVPAPADPVLPATDSLYYAVQVAAFNDLGQAGQAAAELEAAGHTVAISPVRLGQRQVLWYRVLVGALETPARAADARRALWSAGLLPRGEGAVLRVPWAWVLAEADQPALRQQGIPAYIVSGAAGPEVLLGAFETPDQASAAESLLAAAGRPHTLVERRGITR